MADIRVSVSNNLRPLIDARAAQLGVSCPEYLRMLAKLDISIQKYQNAVTYVNVLYNKIIEYHNTLGVYAAPLQTPPIVNLGE